MSRPWDKETTTGIILVGGRSDRMGRDKYHLPWSDGTLLDHLIAEMHGIAAETLLVCREPGQIETGQARIVEDVYAVPCALTGLYSGLRASQHDHNFVLPCDVPFFSSEVGRLIMNEADDDVRAVIPRTPGGLETLYGLYRKSCVPTIEGMFAQGHYAINQLLGRLKIRELDAVGLMRQTHPNIFFNVNTPDDYKRALELNRELGD